MLILAHVGLGKWLATPWKKRLPLFPLLLGTLLPDLIDKPLYYGLAFATGKHGADLGLISGTRSIGHSILFLAMILIWAGITRSRIPLALAVGVITHLLLDNFMEPFSEFTIHSSRIALLFPFYDGRFPVATSSTLGGHLLLHINPFDMLGEGVGFCLLAWDFWGSGWRKRAMSGGTEPR